MAYQELKEQANSLRKAGKFNDAIPVYKELWENYKQECNEWEGWGYAFCLRKVNKPGEALEICREVYKMSPEFPQNNNLYAWCIYDTEINLSEIENEENFLQAASAIVKLTKQEEFSPCTITVLRVLKHFQDPYNADAILEWSEKLRSELLDTSEFIFTDDKSEIHKMASPRERYYSYKTEALLHKEKYQECISLSEKALNDSSITLHHDNDIWFKRRIAKANYHLGNYQDSIKIFAEIVAKRKEWFIQKEIAEIYYHLNKYEDALKFAIDSALSFSEPEKKLRLFQLMADILSKKGDITNAKMHIEYIYAIRIKNNWLIKDEFKSLMRQYQIDTSNLISVENYQQKLAGIWQTMKYIPNNQLTGSIKSILSNGKAGFIETSDNESYYFRLNSFKGNIALIKPGTKVSFFLEDGFDKKKNKETKNAVNIQLI